MKVQILAASGTDSVLANSKQDFQRVSRYRIRTCSTVPDDMAGTESVLLLRVSMLSMKNGVKHRPAGVMPHRCCGWCFGRTPLHQYPMIQCNFPNDFG